MLGPEKLRSNPRDVEENMLRDKSSRACPQAMILADLTSSILQTIVSALPMLGWPKTDFLSKRCQSNQLSILDMPGAVKPFCARTPTLIGVTCFVLPKTSRALAFKACTETKPHIAAIRSLNL